MDYTLKGKVEIIDPTWYPPFILDYFDVSDSPNVDDRWVSYNQQKYLGKKFKCKNIGLSREWYPMYSTYIYGIIEVGDGADEGGYMELDEAFGIGEVHNDNFHGDAWNAPNTMKGKVPISLPKAEYSNWSSYCGLYIEMPGWKMSVQTPENDGDIYYYSVYDKAFKWKPMPEAKK